MYKSSLWDQEERAAEGRWVFSDFGIFSHNFSSCNMNVDETNDVESMPKKEHQKVKQIALIMI